MAANDTETDLKETTRFANEYGSDFIELFYKTFDTKRHDLQKYYTNDSKVIWNGNEIKAENRNQFHLDLPDTTHNIDCYDIHPILDKFNQSGHYMILISVSGTSRYKGYDTKLFYQNFMLGLIEDKWKIISDCFRFAE